MRWQLYNRFENQLQSLNDQLDEQDQTKIYEIQATKSLVTFSRGQIPYDGELCTLTQIQDVSFALDLENYRRQIQLRRDSHGLKTLNHIFKKL